MIRAAAAAVLAISAAALLFTAVPARIVVQLPAGVLEIHDEMQITSHTEVRGAPSGTVLRMAPDFRGRAALVVHGAGIRLRDFTVEGNRETEEFRSGLPPYNVTFAQFTPLNGVLAQNAGGLTVERVEFRKIAGFALLVSGARSVAIEGVRVFDSGSRNAAGRNNTTGGILLEEGTRDFRVTHCVLRDIRGNGIWTHSLYTSPRNGPGLIAGNRIESVGRDAIQVGHAFDVRVEANTGTHIGYPADAVDIEGRAIPAALDTAGNVSRSSYSGNRFAEINGKCIDLDGFHHGNVAGNTCVNRAGPEAYRYGGYGVVMNNTNPDMRSENIHVVDNVIDGSMFGGIFVIGSKHLVLGNRLLNLNIAHCNEEAARFGCYHAAGEPDMLRSGIYLGKGAERPAPAAGNVIENNEISGFEMKARCIGVAPGVQLSANRVRDNVCRQ
jgi:hypothetical protein